jgi:hypothetical protein
VESPVEIAREACPFVTGLSGWKSLVKPSREEVLK